MTALDDNYSINYTPPTAVGGDKSINNNIIIPGNNGASSLSTPSTTNKDDEGIVITPDPSGIVIKTRLVKENQGHYFGDNNNESPYVPSSLATITSPDNTTSNDGNKIDEVKIFLNIVSHPIIDKPAQRNGLDDETGKEVSGWRLPTSMGELRPTFDKGGNAAFAADCILNPEVIRRMNTDPNHFHFVCDLVIQCASRKFGATLDRRFKTPRMKYAGYVDELTSLPIMPETDGGSTQKSMVVKQRVKGRKSAIVEEVGSSSSVASDKSSKKKSLALISEVSSIETTTQAEFHIELSIVGNGDDSKCMSLLDFLKLVADQDDLVPQGQPSSKLREMIRSPKLKDDNKDSTLHVSQLLVTPMPVDITSLLQSSSDLSWLEGGCSIIAKCSIQQSGSATNLEGTPPAVELSAFLLVLSSKDVKTECILPFPVDTRQASKTFNQDNGVVEVQLPLLHMNINDGPDIGTEQWKIQNAFGGGSKKKSGKEEGSTQDVSTSSYQNKNTLIDDDDGFDESQPLAEDAFHAQDILSTHNLQLQEEERESRSSNSSRQGLSTLGN